MTFPPGGTILSRLETEVSFDLSVSHEESFATVEAAFGGGQGFPDTRLEGGSALTSLAFLAAGNAASSSRALFRRTIVA